MRNASRPLLAAMLLVLPVAASAAEAPKGVGKLGCVKPIVPHSEGHGAVFGGPHKCVDHWERCQDGWFAHVTSPGGNWPWLGPFGDRETAAINAWYATYGHGC